MKKQKSTILCLSGWGQKSESLQAIFNDFGKNYQIINFDYNQFSSIESLFTELSNLDIQPEIIIGWSLGGQLAIRSILAKIFKPKLLILLATPFQFVACPRVQTIGTSEKLSTNIFKNFLWKNFASFWHNIAIFCQKIVKFIPKKIKKIGTKKQILSYSEVPAMPKTTFNEFTESFTKLPNKTLKRFMALMLMNDKKAKHNIKSLKDLYLEIDETNYENLLFWLKELGRFSCHHLDFKLLPKSLIIHGSEDMVINVNQSKLLAKKIANCKLEIFNNCSHIIHLHDLEKLQSIIKQQIDESHI